VQGVSVRGVVPFLMAVEMFYKTKLIVKQCLTANF
jgi:hypothetical protein